MKADTILLSYISLSHGVPSQWPDEYAWMILRKVMYDMDGLESADDGLYLYALDVLARATGLADDSNTDGGKCMERMIDNIHD
jgi:hypothetical protein